MTFRKWTMIMLLMLLISSVVSAQSDPQTQRIAFIGIDDQNSPAYRGALLAIEEQNEAEIQDQNGVTYDLELTYYHADSPSQAQEAYTQAVNDEAIAVLGLSETAHLEAVLSANPILPIPILTTENGITSTTNLYRLSTPTNQQAQALATYLREERFYEAIILVGADTQSAQDGLTAFSDIFGADNIAQTLTHSADATDFSADAQAIRDADADAVFMWTFDAQAHALLSALDEIGWRGLIAYNGLDADFMTTIPADLGAGIIGMSGWSDVIYAPKNHAFLSAYHTRWSSEANHLAVAYYDAVNHLVESLRTGTTLSALDFDGVGGLYADNNAQTTHIIVAIQNGNLAELGRYDGLTCVNCPDLWVQNINDVSIENTSVYTIALITQLEGINEAMGIHIQQGIELAIRQINDAGGFIGADEVRYRLQLQTYHATTPEETAQAMNEAVKNGAQVIFGPDTNAQVIPNLALTLQNKPLQWVSVSGLSNSLINLPDSVMQLNPNDATRARVSVNYVLNQLQLTEMALVGVRTDYGLDTLRVLEDEIAHADEGRVVLRLEHNITDDNAPALAEQIAQSEAQAVFIWSTQPYTTALIQALADLRWDGTIVIGYVSPDFVYPSPANLQLIAPVSWWTSASDWASLMFIEAYDARYGASPTPYSATYYDAVYLLKMAIQSVGADSAAMQTWLNSEMDFIGVQGQYTPSTDELSRNVLLVNLSADGVSELARYRDVACVAWCK